MESGHPPTNELTITNRRGQPKKVVLVRESYPKFSLNSGEGFILNSRYENNLGK